MIIEDTLKKSSIFSALSEEDIKNIRSMFEVLSVEPGEFMFRETEVPEWVYIASEGKIKITKHVHSGSEVIVEIKNPGELFCCAAVLGNKPYPDSAQSMEPATVLRIRRSDFLRIIEEYPLLHLQIMRYTSQKVGDAQEMLKNIALERVDRRIAIVLVRLAEKAGVQDGDFIRIDFPLKRQEIAEMVGTTIESCIRAMSKFKKSGWVERSDSRILVKINELRSFLDS
ncbi:MAG: Crp/Fnr family transcriptional regulator [Nitrospira sp.]|nr:Crp/Fnr family transcriptional regulator [bacterium]MBL7048983.1 Crp/Fnr family transcriptional regulator [Nitrospira sp.]